MNIEKASLSGTFCHHQVIIPEESDGASFGLHHTSARKRSTRKQACAPPRGRGISHSISHGNHADPRGQHDLRRHRRWIILIYIYHNEVKSD